MKNQNQPPEDADAVEALNWIDSNLLEIEKKAGADVRGMRIAKIKFLNSRKLTIALALQKIVDVRSAHREGWKSAVQNEISIVVRARGFGPSAQLDARLSSLQGELDDRDGAFSSAGWLIKKLKMSFGGTEMEGLFQSAKDLALRMQPYEPFVASLAKAA
jgi:hypothetical protein